MSIPTQTNVITHRQFDFTATDSHVSIACNEVLDAVYRWAVNGRPLDCMKPEYNCVDNKLSFNVTSPDQLGPYLRIVETSVVNYAK